MKLKNLKIYLLAVFAVFLLSLKTQAVDLNIQAPLPGNFFQDASENNGSKKIIIDIIINALENKQKSHPEESDSIAYLIEIFNNMKNSLENTSITAHATYIDTLTNEISQSMYMKFQKQMEIPVFLRSTYKQTIIRIPNEFPDCFFKNIKTSENNKYQILKRLRDFIPENQTETINLFNTLLADSKNVRIEETMPYDTPPKYTNQCVLISHKSDFYFFNFQSPINPLKKSK